jgi:hypothetical protein
MVASCLVRLNGHGITSMQIQGILQGESNSFEKNRQHSPLPGIFFQHTF